MPARLNLECEGSTGRFLSGSRLNYIVFARDDAATEMLMTKGPHLLVAALENDGVDRIYGIPGEENLDVVDAIRRSSIELALTRHEQSAASWQPPTVASPANLAYASRPLDLAH